jgi:hypothetical protein
MDEIKDAGKSKTKVRENGLRLLACQPEEGMGKWE